MKVVPFKQEHLYTLRLQDAQSMFYDRFTPGYGRALEDAGHSYTGLVEDAPIICAGIVEQWKGRGLAWALISPAAGPHFFHITKAVKRMLDMPGWTRIEAHVDAEFDQGIRWALMLGFEVESKMAKFTPEGRDAFMFVRLK